MQSETEPLLDIAQAAALLQVSEASLRRWTNLGLLACLRVGRKRERRFRRADLLAFLEEEPRAARRDVAGADASRAQRAVIGGIPVPLGGHLCSFYDSDETRIRQAVAFLADGFGADRVAFLVAEPDVRAAILARLEAVRPTLQADIESGRLRLARYASSMESQLEFWETGFLAAIGAGARAIRVVGDASSAALTMAVDAAGLLDYEREFDQQVARRFPVVTLCQYDARRLSGLDAVKQLRLHSDTFAYSAERVLG